MPTAAPQSDPYADIVQPAAPPQGAGGGDPYADIVQPTRAQTATTPPAAPRQGFGNWLERGGYNPLTMVGRPDPYKMPDNGEEAGMRGLVKTGAQSVATLLDLYRNLQTALVTAPPKLAGVDVTKEPGYQTFANLMNHVKDAADWLRAGTEPQGTSEWAGAIGEQAMELMGPAELLKVAGPVAKAGELAEAGETLSKAERAANTIKSVQKLQEALRANPKAAGYMAIGVNMAKNAALGAGQTYLHTEDPGQAAIVGATGAGLGLVMDTIAPVSRYLMRKVPQYVERLGQTFPVLAAQLNEKGAILEGNVSRFAPDVYAEQQAALPGAVKNLAQRGVANAVDAINATRPELPQTIEDTSHLLPAPERTEPFFSIGTTPTAETPTGELVQSAAKVPGRPAAFEPQYTTASAPTREQIRPGGPTRTEGQMGADIRSTPTPTAAGETVGGGPARATNNPNEALQWQTDLEKFQRTPEFKKLPAAQQERVNQAVKDLNERLGMYYESPYAQRFGPEKLPDMLDKTGDFADAQAQLEHAAKPVYGAMDKASNGEFSQWNNAYKRANQTLANASESGMSLEAQDAAIKARDEAERNINKVIDDHRGAVTFDDYMAAKNTWQRAARMGDLHAMLEDMMNGVTPTEQLNQGKERLMVRGSAERFENYLRTGDNRQQIEELIGQDGVAHLKDFLDMFSHAPENRAMQQVARTVAGTLQGHRWFADAAGGGIGGTVAAALGMPYHLGSLAGAAGVEGLRFVLRQAATNPDVGRMVMYAAQNKVNPQVYAPLIARTLASLSGQQAPQPQ